LKVTDPLARENTNGYREKKTIKFSDNGDKRQQAWAGREAFHPAVKRGRRGGGQERVNQSRMKKT